MAETYPMYFHFHCFFNEVFSPQPMAFQEMEARRESVAQKSTSSFSIKEENLARSTISKPYITHISSILQACNINHHEARKTRHIRIQHRLDVPGLRRAFSTPSGGQHAARGKVVHKARDVGRLRPRRPVVHQR